MKIRVATAPVWNFGERIGGEDILRNKYHTKLDDKAAVERGKQNFSFRHSDISTVHANAIYEKEWNPILIAKIMVAFDKGECQCKLAGDSSGQRDTWEQQGINLKTIWSFHLRNEDERHHPQATYIRYGKGKRANRWWWPCFSAPTGGKNFHERSHFIMISSHLIFKINADWA